MRVSGVREAEPVRAIQDGKRETAEGNQNFKSNVYLMSLNHRSSSSAGHSFFYFHLQLAEEEEVRRLRKELVPKAQPMPYFDRPFIPRR